jgi:hypothetical protein
MIFEWSAGWREYARTPDLSAVMQLIMSEVH